MVLLSALNVSHQGVSSNACEPTGLYMCHDSYALARAAMISMAPMNTRPTLYVCIRHDTAIWLAWANPPVFDERTIEGVYVCTYHIRNIVLELHGRSDNIVSTKVTHGRVGVTYGTDLALWTLVWRVA